MSVAKKLTIAVIALGLLCAVLLAYFTHGHLTRRDAGDACPPPLSVSDFRWFVDSVSIDRSVVRTRLGRRAQDHFGEYEFAVLEAAINSFVPLGDDVTPPWYYYDDSVWIWPPREWHFNNAPLQPFDTIFTLWALDDHFGATFWYAEIINFGYSETYGAFAAALHGNFPRGARCGVRRYFRVDTDAFFALLNVLELGADRVIHTDSNPIHGVPTE